MRISDLINNREFCFNVPFRIMKYIGEDNTIEVYSYDNKNDIPYEVTQKWISAINIGSDGIVEIEYVI